MIKWRNFCVCILWLGITARVQAQGKKPVITFVSDTQAPLLAEHVIRKLHHNTKATELIFQDIINTHPASLFILGDVVSLGYQNSKWRKMDAYLQACSQNHIPVYALLGNHELMLNACKGATRFQSRFPAHNPAGYVEIVDSVAVVLLNSNFNKMPDSLIKKQDSWYVHTIHRLDADEAVKWVIVGCHHSPYTNSKVVTPSVMERQKFVPAFVSSKKGMLFLSGHSHNFEHFNQQGKEFLVIGGGGGPHQPLSSRQKTPDISASYKPMFHYLMVERSQDSVKVISRQLKNDFSGFTDGLIFYVHHF